MCTCTTMSFLEPSITLELFNVSTDATAFLEFVHSQLSPVSLLDLGMQCFDTLHVAPSHACPLTDDCGLVVCTLLLKLSFSVIISQFVSYLVKWFILQLEL